MIDSAVFRTSKWEIEARKNNVDIIQFGDLHARYYFLAKEDHSAKLQITF